MPSAGPRDQQQWLAALLRQEWVQTIRIDGRRNLRRVALLATLYADWDTLETRPTWAKLLQRSRLSERTVARWLQELRVRGWLVWIERGSTPATRPMTLAHLAGNRAAVYGLRIPLTPEEALHRLVARLAQQAAAARPAAEDTGAPPSPSVPPSTEPTGDLINTAPDQAKSGPAGEESGSPPTSVREIKNSSSGGLSRASKPVDNSTSDAADPSGIKRTALRADSFDEKGWPDWATRVPTSRAQMLVAADWLRCQRPVLAQLSRKLVRHLCRPYWRAGWCNRDILHALDFRPSVFGQPSGLLCSPDEPAAPASFVRSRLAAWRSADTGAVLPGYWTTRVNDAATAKAARRHVAVRHGRAGAKLLRPGERRLTADRIAEHGRASRPPVRPETRAAAMATAAAAHRRAADRRAADRNTWQAQLIARARAEFARNHPHHRAGLGQE